MEALILCGGFATRLEPLTLFVPKPLLPIGGKPILDYIVEDLAKSDVTRIIISVNRKFESQFRYWLSSKKALGFPNQIELVVEPTVSHGHKFGAIKGIEYAIEEAGIRSDLVIVAGDNFYDWKLSEMVAEFGKSGKHPMVCVHNVQSLEEAKKFGVVSIDNGAVAGFEEKPSSPKSTLVSTGIYIYPQGMLGRFKEYLDTGNTPDAPGYFLQWLIKRTPVKSFKMDGKWFDIGTLGTYKEVFSMFE